MPIEFASLGSGSSGNATLIRTADVLVMVDCGFSAREAEKRARRLGVELSSLAAILVTHEHSDHIKGVGALARKHNVAVYMTPGTHLSRSYGLLPSLQYIQNSYQPFSIGSLNINPVPVPHDAADPVQYVLECNNTRIGVVTDLGSVTPRVVTAFSQCHGLLLEANHDVQMLAQGPYPQSLKQRVGGAWGHLNNQQAIQLLNELDTSRLQKLVIGHISTKNNRLDLLQLALKSIQLPVTPAFACQSEGFEWIKVESTAQKALEFDTF